MPSASSSTIHSTARRWRACDSAALRGRQPRPSWSLFVANVPAYSPEAVAEFAVALTQTLNRKSHRAYNRVRDGNFNIEGLLGTTLHGKTLGIVGVGRIGLAAARIRSTAILVNPSRED